MMKVRWEVTTRRLSEEEEETENYWVVLRESHSEMSHERSVLMLALFLKCDGGGKRSKTQKSVPLVDF